jgi:nucleoside-diphosphate-sugar epimerase
MRTVLLTGGTGFLGGHVARALAREAWRVRAIARDLGRAQRLAADGVEIRPGDLSRTEDLESAAVGCEAIVHVAGLVKARTLEDYREVNRRGTETLLRAASKAAPGALFLFVSSQAAAGPVRDGRPVGESDPARPISWYGLSKLEGEQAVARMWPGPWIILRPAVVYGPQDRGLLVLFRAAARGFLPVPGGRRRIQVIEAGDAAVAIARAASRPDLSGRTGFLADPAPIAIADLCKALARLPSRRPLLVPIPDLSVRIAGWLETIVETLTRRSLPFNADKAREILAGDWLCDPLPMRTDLQLPAPTPLEDGLRKTWKSYVDSGWLIL